MTHAVLVHPAAVTDLHRAVRTHDRQTPKIGRLVSAALGRVVERLRSFPLAFPRVSTGIHSAALGAPPYHVLYTVAGRQVILIAVPHSRRGRCTIERHHRDPLHP
jgi:plasmid stabilization system protein ParE